MHDMKGFSWGAEMGRRFYFWGARITFEYNYAHVSKASPHVWIIPLVAFRLDPFPWCRTDKVVPVGYMQGFTVKRKDGTTQSKIILTDGSLLITSSRRSHAMHVLFRSNNRTKRHVWPLFSFRMTGFGDNSGGHFHTLSDDFSAPGLNGEVIRTEM